MYGEPGGLDGEVTIAAAAVATPATSPRRSASGTRREPSSRSPRTSASTTSTASSRSPTCTPSGGIPTSSRRSSTARSARLGSRTSRSTSASSTRRGAVKSEEVEEVTIPVLSTLDDKWADYSIDFLRRMATDERPWFLYHSTRGAHFDNYPHERFLGSSPAKHPYKDTIVELDDIVGRLVETLRETGQLEHTMIVVTSDNGPEMETWPDAAYTPFRCAKGSTWEGGVRVPAVVSWPGMIDAGPIVRRALRPDGPLPDRARHSPASTTPLPDRPLHRRRRPDIVPTGARRRVEPQVPVLLARPDLLGPAGRRVQVHDVVDLRQRHRRPQPGWIHRSAAEVPLRRASTTCTWTRRRRTRTSSASSRIWRSSGRGPPVTSGASRSTRPASSSASTPDPCLDLSGALATTCVQTGLWFLGQAAERAACSAAAKWPRRSMRAR